MGVEDRTEFEGGGVMPNTVYPKGADSLTNGDRLRLQSITGQDTDSRAPVDDYHWYGNVRPDPMADQLIQAEQKRKREQIKSTERNRYKESPY